MYTFRFLIGFGRGAAPRASEIRSWMLWSDSEIRSWILRKFRDPKRFQFYPFYVLPSTPEGQRLPKRSNRPEGPSPDREVRLVTAEGPRHRQGKALHPPVNALTR